MLTFLSKVTMSDLISWASDRRQVIVDFSIWIQFRFNVQTIFDLEFANWEQVDSRMCDEMQKRCSECQRVFSAAMDNKSNFLHVVKDTLFLRYSVAVIKLNQYWENQVLSSKQCSGVPLLLYNPFLALFIFFYLVQLCLSWIIKSNEEGTLMSSW